jgi:hypothetical protein
MRTQEKLAFRELQWRREEMAHVKVQYPDGKWKIATTKPWPPAEAKTIADAVREFGIRAKVALA